MYDESFARHHYAELDQEFAQPSTSDVIALLELRSRQLRASDPQLAVAT